MRENIWYRCGHIGDVTARKSAVRQIRLEARMKLCPICQWNHGTKAPEVRLVDATATQLDMWGNPVQLRIG